MHGPLNVKIKFVISSPYQSVETVTLNRHDILDLKQQCSKPMKYVDLNNSIHNFPSNNA